MPHYPDSKDEGSDRRGGQLETDYHWLPFDSPLTKILTRRLKDVVELNPLQKAFRKLEGCAKHIILIHGLIRDARKRNRSIFVVFLDLAKTFDSVNHDLLFRGQRSQSCPD